MADILPFRSSANETPAALLARIDRLLSANALALSGLAQTQMLLLQQRAVLTALVDAPTPPEAA